MDVFWVVSLEKTFFGVEGKVVLGCFGVCFWGVLFSYQLTIVIGSSKKRCFVGKHVFVFPYNNAVQQSSLLTDHIVFEF